METLNAELLQYETQLSQIQLAISSLEDGPERDGLVSLQKEINELIKLTKESLQQEEILKNDSLDDEYKLFEAELGISNLNKHISDGSPNQNTNDTDSSAMDDLTSDLKAIEGMKCQAPYKYAWTEDFTYHNALIFCIENINDITNSDEIQVRVMFTNPTHKEMLPCPFYLDGDCKFSDDKCRFSHGEKVFFKSLRDYREPDFGNVVEGCCVLAKKEDGLWHRGIIKSIDGVKCIVKFDSNAEEETQLQNILPLEGDIELEESDSSNEDENYEYEKKAANEEIVRRILMSPSTSALGDWEKFTKGFGSRIMAKMGYIHGSGLGKEGTGRVEPVSAVILPAGKSLDHCMMLRERSGGDEDFFKAERKLKRLQKKQEKMLEKSYEREKKRTDVFVFLNNNLGQSNALDNEPENSRVNLQCESVKSLSVTSLRLGEEVRKVEKEVKCLKNSLSRYSSRSKEFSILRGKLTDRQEKLAQLKASEQRVINEQERRRDRKKLTVF